MRDYGELYVNGKVVMLSESSEAGHPSAWLRILPDSQAPLDPNEQRVTVLLNVNHAEILIKMLRQFVQDGKREDVHQTIHEVLHRHESLCLDNPDDLELLERKLKEALEPVR